MTRINNVMATLKDITGKNTKEHIDEVAVAPLIPALARLAVAALGRSIPSSSADHKENDYFKDGVDFSDTLSGGSYTDEPEDIDSQVDNSEYQMDADEELDRLKNNIK